MRLRRRPAVEEPPPSPPPREVEDQAPVAEAAFAFRAIMESIPGGDRDRVWSRVVAAVEQELTRQSPDDPADDGSAVG